MITMAILSSHLVIVNHKGEISSSLESLIGMSLYAKMQMQSFPMKPKLFFVLRDQINSDKKIFQEQLNKFKDNLRTSSSFLKVNIDDELEITSDNICLLPSAFSEDINPDLGIKQQWRNSTFPYNIHDLRKHIFAGLKQHSNSFYSDFTMLYNKMTSNWKTIDDLGQGLLECKSLAELKITNELKSLTQEIYEEKSRELYDKGKTMLEDVIQKWKDDDIQTPSDVIMKTLSEEGTHKLDILTRDILNGALEKFDEATQAAYYSGLKARPRESIDPLIRSTQNLLYQRFQEDLYDKAKTNAQLSLQKQMLNKCNEFFIQNINNGNADFSTLKAELAKRRKQLEADIRQNLSLLRKTPDEIRETILNIYNTAITARKGNAEKTIYNQCKVLSPATFEDECRNLDNVFQSIFSYLKHPKQPTGKWWNSFFSHSKWDTFAKQLHWFKKSDSKDNQRIFMEIIEEVVEKVNHNVSEMLSSIQLAYNDQAVIIGLLQHVSNAMQSQQSPIQKYYNGLNVPQITMDLVLISLRLLIDQSITITNRKHEELEKSINKLDDWEKEIEQQFNLMKNSTEQATNYRRALQQNIISEAFDHFRQVTIKSIDKYIAERDFSNSTVLAEAAYAHSIQTGDANEIMKYVSDINRYYLERALEKVRPFRSSTIEGKMIEFQDAVLNCARIASEVVEKHGSRDISVVHNSISTSIKRILPNYNGNKMMVVQVEITKPDQFKQSFKAIAGETTKMQENVKELKSEMEKVITEACKTIVTSALGCASICPGCGTKCQLSNQPHSHHTSKYHLAGVFHGWRIKGENTPYLVLCYQNWATSDVVVGEETIHPKSKYYKDRAPEWFQNLNQMANYGPDKDNSIPPEDQRKAWMKVRKTIVKRFGLVDLPNYSKEYDTTIQSSPENFVEKWIYD
ncbi:unnamed protein product [Adineta steineri]|nr:unnamed protein product [Adineta steineri]